MNRVERVQAPSSAWRLMSTVYKHFARQGPQDAPGLILTDKAALDAYLYETASTGPLAQLGGPKKPYPDGRLNGFLVGKSRMDQTVDAWRLAVLNRVLLPSDLYSDPDLVPYRWWLDRVVPGIMRSIYRRRYGYGS